MRKSQSRREFLRTAAAAAVAPTLFVRGPWRDPMERIGLTTVTFRFRFAQTRPSGYAGSEPLLTLPQVPEFFADRFGVHNVELWSQHFEARSPAYLSDIRRALDRAGSRLINIQIDETYNLADANEEGRASSVELVKEWVEVARQLGAGSVRANAGNGDVAAAVRSLREVSDHAGPLGVPVLVENHGGISTNPEVLLTILDAIPGGHFGAVTDFGNFDPDTDRFAAMARLIPRSWLISAKTQQFDAAGNHVSYDFDRCVQTCEEAGYHGVYSAEQWDPSREPRDFEAIADYMIERIKANI